MPLVRTVPIAGWRYYRHPVLRRLRPGAALRLVRENHPKDALAVQIWAGETKLGYVPKANNVEVAWAIDGKRPVTATFAGLQEQDEPAITLTFD